MNWIKEFRDFASRGNVVDLAVGIIIGAAFGKIVTSAVNDILMPPIGLLVGGLDFSDLRLHLSEAVTLNYGNFIQTCVDFVIQAFAVFLVIKAVNRLNRKQETAPPPPSKQEVLLTDIRDLLKSKK